MSGYKQRTDAERDAIDERAAAWKRPARTGLTWNQHQALTALAEGELTYTVAGFADAPPITHYHSSQTVLSLATRKLCAINGTGKHRRARITAKGREALQKEAVP